MANNVTTDPGSGGADWATDEDAGSVHYQVIKLADGTENSTTRIEAGGGLEATSLRVTLPTDGTGVVTANLSATDNAVLDTIDAVLDTINAKLVTGTVIGDVNINGTATVSGTVTANLSATDNAVLDTIDAVLDTINAKLVTGTTIGDVNVIDVIPGTGATNLGKAIDSVSGATDTGVVALAVHQGDTSHLTSATGDYEYLRISEFGGLQVEPEQHHVLDSMNATTGWTVLGNDTANLATTTKHTMGTNALSFDKVDGAANTVFGAIQKTISSTDLGGLSPHDIIQTVVQFSSVADIDYVFVRLGTDSTNYNEWRIDGIDLTGAIFETLAFEVGDASHVGITGNGWDPSAVTYVTVGCAFNSENDTLAAMIFDELSFHTNQHTNASINSEVTSSVSSANVNLQKVGGSATDKGAGNASQGSQRVVLATDDVNAAAIAAAVAPRTSGGLSMHSYLSDGVGDDEQVIKASAGQLYGLTVTNTNAAVRYIKVYNDSTDPDVTTDTPVLRIAVPGDAAGAGVNLKWEHGLEFTTGIAYVLVTGVADTDSTAVAANEIIVNAYYE